MTTKPSEPAAVQPDAPETIRVVLERATGELSYPGPRILTAERHKIIEYVRKDLAAARRGSPSAAEVLGLLTVHLLQEHWEEAREIAKEIRIDYTTNPPKPIAIDFTTDAQLAELREALRQEADQLESWAHESRAGGWSTHQVKPMLERAKRLREIAR